MKTTNWSSRLLSLLLAACIILSLIPATMPAAQAEESVSVVEESIQTQITNLVSSLTAKYASFGIPKLETVNFTTGNLNSLEGYYFMVVGQNAAQGYRVIDYGTDPQIHELRLTANSYELLKGNSSGNPDSYKHLFSLPANLGPTINGSYPQNLDYAIELVPNRVSVSYNTTTSDGGYTGWQNYTNWEFNRKNGWSINESFGPYLFIPEIPKKTDTAYNIRSLHPSRISSPWLSCYPNSGQMQYSTSPFPFFFKPQGSSCKIYKTGPNADSIYNYWLGCDTMSTSTQGKYYITAATISQIVREDRNYNTDDYDNLHNAFAFNWTFYRINGLVVDLFRALDKAKTYALGNNPGVSSELYLEFLQLTANAMEEYNTYRNHMNSSRTDPTRVRLDILAKELDSLTELLPIEADPNSYSDIPLQILDFRADGLMFECKNSGTAYSLGSAAPQSVGGANRPGNPESGEVGGYMDGLISTQLVDGKIVYRKETVDYIAAALDAGHHTFADTTIDFGEGYLDTYYNKTFMDMVDNGILIDGVRVPMEKGDYYETLNKTSTKENGGELSFSQVRTYYDLAYYMLTYIWRPTPSDDIVETVQKDGKTFDLSYNKTIDEIDTIRLIKNSAGQYTFSSDYENGRHVNGGIIYNYKSFKQNNWKEPKINSAAGLGFESPDLLGVNSTGAREGASTDVYQDRNYHVVYHMESAFVYYESKNLNFTFSGDDDVYFFINDQLVCDIGGLHSACKRSVSLKGAIAQNLGLQDGDICTFDMYLAERKLTGLN